MNYEFHPEALAEFVEAAQYYAAKGGGLAHRFIADMQAAFDRLSENPLQYPIVEQDVRRCLTRMFPYAVLYTIEADFVLIVAVTHCHRKPGYWRWRMASDI